MQYGFLHPTTLARLKMISDLLLDERDGTEGKKDSSATVVEKLTSLVVQNESDHPV